MRTTVSSRLDGIQEVLPRFVAKTNCSRSRRAKRTSLSFHHSRHNCAGRSTLPGDDTTSREKILIAVDSRRIHSFHSRCCVGELRFAEETIRRATNRVSPRRESLSYRAWALWSLTLNHTRSWRAINMGRRILDDEDDDDDDDGYVPRFRLALACYYFRLDSRKSTESTREKNQTFI